MARGFLRVMRKILVGHPCLYYALGEGVCVKTTKAKHQRRKPHSFCGVYVVAEATTHKQSHVATRILKPLDSRGLTTRLKPRPTNLHASIQNLGAMPKRQAGAYQAKSPRL
jgi:hypothetical protein